MALIPYLGGKSRLAKTIISKMPEHTCYVEVFAGGAAVFFKKPPSKSEIINDMDKDLITLYRVVKNHQIELHRQFELMLVSRSEFERLRDTNPETLTDIQRAARYLYLQRTCFGAHTTGRTFATVTTGRNPQLNLFTLQETLHEAWLRLAHAQIECMDFRQLIPRYDREHTLFYLDPPYWKMPYYVHNLEEQDFVDLSVLLTGIKGKFLMSINDTPEVRDIFGHFNIEEVDYRHTIEQVRHILFEMFPDNIIPVWFQVPFHLTNATSLTEGQLVAWEPGKHKIWMRPKDRRSVQHWPYDDPPTVANKTKGFGFYDVIDNFEAHQRDTCFLVGLRAVESMNRWRAVARNPAHKNWCWTKKATGEGNIKAYPLYDWNFSDIWRYIHDERIPYNKIYDWMWKRGMPLQEIRVSSLIHEKSFKAICELPEFEPDTYNRLVRRLKGIATAQLYGKEREMMRCTKLPKAYKSWREYRDFLLRTYPDASKAPIFAKRFARQLDNNYVARQQCRQLILNDYENNLPIDNKPDPREETIRKWMELL